MLNPHGMYIEAPVSGRVLALWQGLKSALSECAEMHHSEKSVQNILSVIFCRRATGLSATP